MAFPSLKRKPVTRDSPSSGQAALVDELGNGPLDHIISESEGEISGEELGSSEEDEDISSNEEDAADEEELESDEIPSDDDAHTQIDRKHSAAFAPSSKLLPLHRGQHVNGSKAKGEHFQDDPEKSDERGDYEDEDAPNYTVTQDANGNTRYVYREIDPVYDSDDSDAPATTNTIGNIPLSFYDSYPHIGYDLDGKKVMRPATGAALDSLLDSIEVPKGWTGLTDPATGKPLELDDEELDVLRRLTRNEIPEEGYDPYPETIEYFTSKTEPMPLSAAPEPKRRFVPSKHEAVRVMKIVKAIREGRIQPYKPPRDDDEEEEDVEAKTVKYDLWADEAPRPDHPMNMPAPKLPPPGYEESYHPPPEYVPDEGERKAWEDADEEDREKDFLPADHEALRKVPGYEKFVKEKFERCLDLYLAPRVRRSKLNIDPESLLPKLPSPEELRPFPRRCELVFRGHVGRVRSIAIHPQGSLLASGGDDGTVRIWMLDTGRLVWSVTLTDQDAVNVVKWRPGKDASILAAAAGDSIYLMAPDFHIHTSHDPPATRTAHDILNAGWSAAAAPTSETNSTTPKEPAAKWQRPAPSLQSRGVLVQVTVRSTIKALSFHRKGDHLSTVCPTTSATSSAIAIHTISKHQTQHPFRRLRSAGGLPQLTAWHPTKPILFVATQRTVRAYDLAAQTHVKTLHPGARWISALDVHPGGDNLLVASYDRKLLWLDLDLSPRGAYKTLRYHARAVRAARFHPGAYPLFADASDDGTLQVFHGKVVADLLENASIVPLKVLRGHAVDPRGLGVLDAEWHPTEPWLVSAGADGTCRLWRP